MSEIKLYKLQTLFFLILPFYVLEAQSCDNYIKRMSEQVEKKNIEEANKLMKYYHTCREENAASSQQLKILKQIKWISKFDEGYAICGLKDGGYGIVDKDVSNIEKLNYDYANGFSDGLAEVSLNRKRGFVNHRGDVVLKPEKYNSIYKKDQFWIATFQNRHGGKYKEILNSDFDVIFTEKGNFRLGLETEYAKNGYIKVYKERKSLTGNDSKTFENLMNTKGEYFLEDFVEYIDNEFSFGLIRVKKRDKWGFLDNSGQIVIPFSYDFATAYGRNSKLWDILKYDGEHVSRVTIKNKDFLINKKGECLKDCENAPSNHP